MRALLKKITRDLCLLTVVTLQVAGTALGDDSGRRPRLALEPSKVFACTGVEGELVVLVHLDWGAIAVAPESFPGARPVGRIDDGAIYLSIPGLRMPELRLAGHSDPAGPDVLWGRMVAPRGLTGKPGCAALDRPETAKAIDERLRTVTERILGGDS